MILNIKLSHSVLNLISLCRFEFVKSAGTYLVPINLPFGQEMDGKMLKHITGAGPVYLRPLQDISSQIDEVQLTHSFISIIDFGKNSTDLC